MPPPGRRLNFNPKKPLPIDWKFDLRNSRGFDETVKQFSSFNFPGHNYLGPGNQAPAQGNTAPPKDSDDLIAAEHDDNYHSAKTKEDIYNADKQAIREFGSDAINNLNWHSAVGAIGLGAKHGVERLTNQVFYPNLAGKLWHTMLDSHCKKALKKNLGGHININLVF